MPFDKEDGKSLKYFNLAYEIGQEKLKTEAEKKNAVEKKTQAGLICQNVSLNKSKNEKYEV